MLAPQPSSIGRLLHLFISANSSTLAMSKSDPSIRRKKNEKKQNGSSRVSNRITSIIAAKKRQKCGTRRICQVRCTMTQQGMCFNLPTPEDRFHDRQGKPDPMNGKRKPVNSKEDKMLIHEKNLGLNNEPSNFAHTSIDQEQKAILENFKNEQIISKNAFKLENAALLRAVNSLSDDAREGDTYENYDGCPSKFLLMCLNTIQNDLQHDEALINDRGRLFFALPWGFEFWKYYSNGIDILDTSQAHSTVEQIAWIVSTASDTITRREEEGLSITSPFLLYLVPSQQEAVRVRQVCRPLKAHGIHTISLHAGASIDHQIHGLRKCEPEFLISTPERLTELISLNAIDLSGVSLLVIDGSRYEGGSVDAIRTIRNSIPSSSDSDFRWLLETSVSFNSIEIQISVVA